MRLTNFNLALETIVHKLFFRNFATETQCSGSAAGAVIDVREESPGSAGRSTSENGSCRRRQEKAEENNRRTICGKGEKVV